MSDKEEAPQQPQDTSNDQSGQGINAPEVANLIENLISNPDQRADSYETGLKDRQGSKIPIDDQSIKVQGLPPRQSKKE